MLAVAALGLVLLAGCTGAASLEPVHGAPVADAGAVEVSALDAKPKVIQRTAPQYPVALRRAGVTGVAVIDFIIGTDGTVHDAAILDATTEEFGKAAREAVLHWRFQPAMRHGNPVAVHMRVPITFNLNHA